MGICNGWTTFPAAKRPGSTLYWEIEQYMLEKKIILDLFIQSNIFL